VAEVIPLFPLSHVLLPGMPLPLRIFEPRYRDMLADIAEQPTGASFGVVALRSGTETKPSAAAPQAQPDIQPIGTVAEILENEPRDDGTSDLLAIGSRRFRVVSLLTEGRSYLRAEVVYLPEHDGDVNTGYDVQARSMLERYDTILTRVAGRATGAELPTDPTQLSYQIAARLPLPPDERQELLSEETTFDRLDRLIQLLRRETALLQRTRSIAISPVALRMATSAN
jgi:hypothetical protein